MLSDNNIGMDKVLAKALTVLLGGNSIEDLSLSWNRLRSEDLIPMLQVGCKSLKVLDIKFNRLDDQLARSVAKLLNESKTMLQLDLSYNYFGYETYEFFGRALVECKQLNLFRIKGNSLKEEEIQQFESLLPR